MSEGEDQWVTVGMAAEQSGLSTAIVRQLCRSGAVPSRRRNGSSGPYLVSLGAVLSHATEQSEEMDAAYWEGEARRSRAEAAALRADLGRSRAERNELQAELDRIQAQRDELQAELDRTRAAGAEVGPEIEDRPEPGYRGPIRQQLARPPLPDLIEPPEDTVEPDPVAPIVVVDDLPPQTVETPSTPFDDSVLPAEERRRRGLRRRRDED